jgi:hypothetical protein
MSILNVVILAIVQGLAELLPVSSSAHVVVAEKLLGLDPSSPPMTLLLVMLHTGTMFAVITYFWRQWRSTYFSSVEAFKSIAARILLATIITGIVGEVIKVILEKTALKDVPHAEIEDLFGHLEFIAPALAAAGIRASRTASAAFAGDGRRLARARERARRRGRAQPEAGRDHRRGAGPVSALQRFLALRRHHFDRHASRRLQAARRALQLRPRGGADAARRRSRGAAAQARA